MLPLCLYVPSCWLVNLGGCWFCPSIGRGSISELPSRHLKQHTCKRIGKNDLLKCARVKFKRSCERLSGDCTGSSRWREASKLERTKRRESVTTKDYLLCIDCGSKSQVASGIRSDNGSCGSSVAIHGSVHFSYFLNNRLQTSDAF